MVMDAKSDAKSDAKLDNSCTLVKATGVFHQAMGQYTAHVSRDSGSVCTSGFSRSNMFRKKVYVYFSVCNLSVHM